jgi:hypothetical protein
MYAYLGDVSENIVRIIVFLTGLWDFLKQTHSQEGKRMKPESNKIMRLTTWFMLLCFVFMVMICVFIFGINLAYVGIEKERAVGLVVMCAAFFVGILAITGIARNKIKLDIMIKYGEPVFNAAEYIKAIIKKVNVLGVESLHIMIEEAMKKELEKVAEKERKGKGK